VSLRTSTLSREVDGRIASEFDTVISKPIRYGCVGFPLCVGLSPLGTYIGTMRTSPTLLPELDDSVHKKCGCSLITEDTPCSEYTGKVFPSSFSTRICHRSRRSPSSIRSLIVPRFILMASLEYHESSCREVAAAPQRWLQRSSARHYFAWP